MTVLLQYYIPIFIFLFSLIFFIKFGFNYNLTKSKINFFILIWILIWTMEYWFLGPYSYIRYYDEADVGLSRILYDINNHIGGNYLHGIQGGRDFYASQALGGQYLSLERFLFSVFPVWIALFAHKLLLVSFSLIGTYVLLRKTTFISRFQAYCFGVFFSLYHGYLVHSTIQHGIGYAVLPLAIYIFCFLTSKKYYFLIILILSIFITISISVTHSFMIVIFGLILSPLMIKIKNLKNFLLAISFLCFVVLINWSEVLYGMATYGQESSRAVSKAYYKDFNQIIFGGLDYIIGKTDRCFTPSCLIRFSPFVFIIVYTLVLAIYFRPLNYLKLISFLILLFLIPGLIYFISTIKYLQFIQSVNFNRIALITIIPLFMLIGSLIKKTDNVLIKVIPILCICTALFLLTTYKIKALSSVFWGNQIKITSIPNLIEKDSWEPDTLYRGVTTMPYKHFHPNFLWAYNIDTLDGYTNLIPETFTDFWHYGLHKNKYLLPKPEISGGNLYINYTENSVHNKKLDFDFKDIDFNESIDLNFLRLTNTGYIFSIFPIINDNKLKLVSGPITQPYRKSDSFTGTKNIEYIKQRFIKYGKQIFKPSEIYIYEVSNYSERFFFPNHINYLDHTQNIREKYNFVSKHYSKNSTFSSKKNLLPAKGDIFFTKKVKDGYELKVSVEKEGIFVFNVFFSSYWEVYVNNKKVEAVNLEDFHTGVELFKGENIIKLHYNRPLLRDKFKNLFYLK